MTNEELRIEKRKRIRRKRIFLWCLRKVALCIACIMLANYAVKLFGTKSGQISDRETANPEKNSVKIFEAADIPLSGEYVREESPDWQLVLVNHTNPIDEDYIADIKLTRLRYGQSVDSRCYPDLQKMMDDCRGEGYNPVICSSFRTYQKQQELFERQINICMKQGMNRSDAEAEAAKSVAMPGTSEHELGLAVDITDLDNQQIISGMEEQPVQRWLMENSWRYGFILRYPIDKSDITGIVYEPWHYRYVGYEAAKYIYENQITLEEYLDAVL